MGGRKARSTAGGVFGGGPVLENPMGQDIKGGGRFTGANSSVGRSCPERCFCLDQVGGGKKTNKKIVGLSTNKVCDLPVAPNEICLRGVFQKLGPLRTGGKGTMIGRSFRV